MKRLPVILLALLCSSSVAVRAADPPKKTSNPEREKVWKEMLDKYDADKNGKLDRSERAKISADDIKKMEAAGLLGSTKKKTK